MEVPHHGPFVSSCGGWKYECKGLSSIWPEDACEIYVPLFGPSPTRIVQDDCLLEFRGEDHHNALVRLEDASHHLQTRDPSVFGRFGHRYFFCVSVAIASAAWIQ